MSGETIDVVGYEDYGDRGPISEIIKSTINVDQLKQNLVEFIKKIDIIVDELPEFTKSYQMDKIKISVNISATGSVSLAGTGGQVGMIGGVQIELKKKSSIDK
jgi:hypothetical protein